MEPDFIHLNAVCHICGSGLIAFWDYDKWMVDCDNVDCEFTYPERFKDLESLAKKFEAMD